MATVDQMDDQKTHFRHLLHFFLRKRLKPMDVQREICAVYGDSVISCDICERWFARYYFGNGSLGDSAHSGRPIKADYGEILSAIISDWHISTRQIGKQSSIQHSTVARQLKNLGITKNG